MARGIGIASDVSLQPQAPLTDRRTRRPQHSWLLRLRPWQLVPCMIAPVLAGETLKSGMVQCRIVSDPIKNSVTGWWLEFFLFYVRIGDLEVADTVRTAIIDPAQNMSALASAANAQYMHQITTAPSWVYETMRVVTRAYFREETEEWNTFTLDGYPAVGIAGTGWWDSLFPASVLPAETGADSWEKAWSVYVGMRRAKLTTMTWEEYLAESGVSTPPKLREDQQDFRIPELVRFTRDFAYPVPTVDPATGLIAATVQWNLAERIDKRRFFAEPGFLVGYMSVRPKVYMQNQRTVVADTILADANGWLPAVFDTDPQASIVKVAAGSPGVGPVHGGSVDYWFDRKDLYIYGDQFLNIDLSAPPTSAGHWNLVALPATNVARIKYPQLTDAQAMFVTAGAEYLKADGICSVQIASRLQDTTA